MLAPPVIRKDLLKAILKSPQPLAKVEVQEVTMAPGVKAPLHRHPCPTVGVIIEGAISFQIEGQPVCYLKEGDAFYEPAEVRVAKFDNESEASAKFAVFYLLANEGHETVQILSR